MKLNLPNKLKKIFKSDGTITDERYIVLHGGRGSGKSQSAGSIILTLMRFPFIFNKDKKRLNIICAREFGSSIDGSVSELLSRCSRELGIENEFVFEAEKIYHRGTKSIIRFMGLARNIDSIRSKDDVDILWIEEGEHVSKYSFSVIDPSIRADKSKIFIVFNPKDEDGYIYTRFVSGDPRNALVIQINWYDNPWFPVTLNDQRLECLRTEPEMYEHVWEGEPLRINNAQVMHGKWMVDDFEVNEQDWDGPYIGVDWGFSIDPTVITESWINDNKLYVRREGVKVGLELDDTAQFFIDKVPLCKNNTITADCARPESINHVKKKLPKIKACIKWKNSVEEGILKIRAFDKMVIHPSCTEVISEAKKYRYKVTSSGEPTSILVDKDNHCMDSIRYALQGHIFKKKRLRPMIV